MKSLKTISTLFLSFIFSSTFFSCSQKDSEKIIPANDPHINYMGRIYWDENGHGNFNYPGTSALLKFKGTGISMETSPGSGKFVVEIDNQEPKMVMYSPTDSILTLAQML